MGNLYLGEFIGTMVLILLGDGVVANTVLKKTKGNAIGANWVLITAGWGLAVVFGVTTAILAGSPYGFINPAVAIPYAVIGRIGWVEAIGCTIAEILGAFVGAILVYLAYYQHFQETEDPTAKLGVFATIPQIRHLGWNFLTEAIGTFMLVFGVVAISSLNPPTYWTPFIVGMLVFSIGMSLGGPTGYAINPARDLGPRLAHAILPIPGKGSSDWKYGLTVPIFGPIVGGIIGAVLGVAVT